MPISASIPRINPMTTGVLSVTVVDDADVPVTDATVTADIFNPSGVCIQNDLVLAHYTNGVYTAEISPDWSTGDDPDGNGARAVEGLFYAIVKSVTPDELQESERVAWRAAYLPMEE